MAALPSFNSVRGSQAWALSGLRKASRAPSTDANTGIVPTCIRLILPSRLTSNRTAGSPLAHSARPSIAQATASCVKSYTSARRSHLHGFTGCRRS